MTVRNYLLKKNLDLLGTQKQEIAKTFFIFKIILAIQRAIAVEIIGTIPPIATIKEIY